MNHETIQRWGIIKCLRSALESGGLCMQKVIEYEWDILSRSIEVFENCWFWTESAWIMNHAEAEVTGGIRRESWNYRQMGHCKKLMCSRSALFHHSVSEGGRSGGTRHSKAKITGVVGWWWIRCVRIGRDGICESCLDLSIYLNTVKSDTGG